jgi:hypothetical protein
LQAFGVAGSAKPRNVEICQAALLVALTGSIRTLGPIVVETEIFLR